MFKAIWRRWQHMTLWLSAWLTTSAFAEIPKPPDADVANSTNDWITVGGNMTYRVLQIVCLVVMALLIIGCAYNIVKAYHVSQERQDLGHFFKHGAISLLAAAIGTGLLYACYNMIPTS